MFDNVRTYCMFIGYPRSGHTLISSLLDAHPNVIIANEIDTLEYIEKGFEKEQIFPLLFANSQSFASTGREWIGYSYQVPNQWQGKFKTLQVIGDKKGGTSILRLFSKPELLRLLWETIDIEKKFIHVIRNPYDNISTLAMKADWVRDLEHGIEVYFSMCETIVDIKKKLKENEIINIHHELFIDNPRSYLIKLCDFLRVDVLNDYLDDCISIIFKSPHKSRYDTQWTSELISIVKNKIDKFTFLKEYSYYD